MVELLIFLAIFPLFFVPVNVVFAKCFRWIFCTVIGVKDFSRDDVLYTGLVPILWGCSLLWIAATGGREADLAGELRLFSVGFALVFLLIVWPATFVVLNRGNRR